MVISIDGATILTDPGTFTTGQDIITGLDAILITHEHADHLHTESVARVLARNPAAVVITNSAVGAKLTEAKIPFTLLEGRQSSNVKKVFLEAFDCKHEEIYEEWGQVQNTGYFIGGKLFYPGDSFFDPGRTVDVLALPVAGPWCRLLDAIRYALRVKPRVAFPVHDGMLREDRMSVVHTIPQQILAKSGIHFQPMRVGDAQDW